MAKLLTIAFSGDCQVPLKQFVMDNPLHIPPDAQHATPSTLLEVRKPFLGRSFSNRVFFIDGTNVSGGLCSFGSSIELLKKNVSEMFIFLNLTLHSFGPENFVPLVKIRKFQKGVIQKLHELMHQPNSKCRHSFEVCCHTTEASAAPLTFFSWLR
jgi:hypothetical protein